MYAVIETGGKQYKVAENDVVKLEKLEGEVGKVISLDRVLALSDGKTIKIGAPVVEGAKVSAEVLEQKKDKKVIIFKKKRRNNYRRKNGHRQQITVVRILDVSGKGEAKVAPKKAPKAEAPAVEKAEVKAEKAPAKEKAAAPKKTVKKSDSAEKKAPAKKTAKKKEEK